VSGIDNDEAAQILADGMRTNYDFVRPRTCLKCRTHAEVAGLSPQLARGKMGVINQAKHEI
jgi:hypothetical protein